MTAERLERAYLDLMTRANRPDYGYDSGTDSLRFSDSWTQAERVDGDLVQAEADLMVHLARHKADLGDSPRWSRYFQGTAMRELARIVERRQDDRATWARDSSASPPAPAPGAEPELGRRP